MPNAVKSIDVGQGSPEIIKRFELLAKRLESTISKLSALLSSKSISLKHHEKEYLQMELHYELTYAVTLSQIIKAGNEAIATLHKGIDSFIKLVTESLINTELMYDRFIETKMGGSHV